MARQICYSLIIALSALFLLPSCEKDPYDYLDDDDFTFWINDNIYYQPTDGLLSSRYISFSVRCQELYTQNYSLSIHLHDDVDGFKNGQNITDDICVKDLRPDYTVYLGCLDYTIKSGNVYINKTTNNKYELIFKDVEVYARMVNLWEEETHKTYHLNGKLVFEKWKND